MDNFGHDIKKTQIKPQIRLVKELLAQHLGIEPEDINDEDSLTDDLHMSAPELVDFMESLREEEINSSSLDLPSLETVGDLVESLISEGYLE